MLRHTILLGLTIIISANGSVDRRVLSKRQTVPDDVELIQTNEKINLDESGGSIGYHHRGYHQNYFLVPPSINRVQATLMKGDKNHGTIRFEQFGPFHGVTVLTNLTELPVGKHALHIHAYGDISDDCKATGPHHEINMLGNVQVKEDGMLAIIFQSNINLFGPRGIVGRSIVLHEKPIEYQFGPDILGQPLDDPYGIRGRDVRGEENQVGEIVACGVITFVSTPMMPPPQQPEVEPAPTK